MSYSRLLLVTCFIYNSVCILISNSSFIFFSFPFGNHKFVFYMCDSYFFFVNKFICIILSVFSIPHKGKIILFVFLCLTYFINTIISRSILVAANGITSFFTAVYDIPLCVCVCAPTSSLSFHPLAKLN